MSKILLVDDDISFNSTLKKYLEYEGYLVVSAFDGNQGFTLLKQESPDLIITDIIMPNEDGMGFLLKILQEFKGFPCKVIVISGGGRIAGKEYLETARELLGVNTIFEKPFEMDELLASIQQLLSQ